MRPAKLPKREARQQMLEMMLLGIWALVIAAVAAFIGPRFFHTTNYNGRGFAILLGIIFGVPVYSVVMWRIKRRAARVEFRRKNGICVNCGYDLRGNTTGVCPECGEPVEKIETPENEKPARGTVDSARRIKPRS